MTERKYTEAEEKAIDRLNRVLGNIGAQLLANSLDRQDQRLADPDLALRDRLRTGQTKLIPGLHDKDGQPVEIPYRTDRIGRGQHGWLYYQVPKGKQHCYTPWKDTEGRYWAFTLVPKGPGARTGKAKKWALRNEVSFTTRKAAKQRALDRFYKDGS